MKNGKPAQCCDIDCVECVFRYFPVGSLEETGDADKSQQLFWDHYCDAAQRGEVYCREVLRDAVRDTDAMKKDGRSCRCDWWSSMMSLPENQF